MSSTGQIPLWRQLQAAATALQVVRAGSSTQTALAAVELPLRPGVQSILFQALRQLGAAEVVRRQLVQKAPAAWVDALLCTTLALLWPQQERPYQDHTLVDQAVEAVKRQPGCKPQLAFVNACLRRFLRERLQMWQSLADDPVARWQHPAWWIKRVQQDHPTDWQAVLAASNQAAPLTLRVNQRHISVEAYLRRLADAGIVARAAGASGVVLERAGAVTELPGFAEGWISVQDGSAQLAAPLLLQGWEQRQGLWVLDACAAPGGKTSHLLEISQARVLALEIDAQRAKRIQDNLQRLRLMAELRIADAAQPQSWLRPEDPLFDAILLDAPCSASGIVRRHPDVRWLRRPQDLDQLAQTQARLLQTLWPLLKPGGRLLYCTCSIFRQEGVDQVKTFLARNTDAALMPSPGHLLPGSHALAGVVSDNRENHEMDGDGFYYALLEKQGRAQPQH